MMNRDDANAGLVPVKDQLGWDLNHGIDINDEILLYSHKICHSQLCSRATSSLHKIYPCRSDLAQLLGIEKSSVCFWANGSSYHYCDACCDNATSCTQLGCRISLVSPVYFRAIEASHASSQATTWQIVCPPALCLWMNSTRYFILNRGKLQLDLQLL